jgi:hypothetical protein
MIARLSHYPAAVSRYPGGSAVLAESALAILVPRRNSGDPASRLSCRALIRRWVAVLRGAA